MFLKSTIFSAILAAASVMSATAQAQTYPSKPIRMIVPVPPGGGSDAIARVLADRMSQSMKQTVVVENKPGAGGLIGSDQVAKAPADGYTVLLINNAFVINPWLYKLPYDTKKDFAPITIVATSPNLLVANPSLPVNNVTELVALAKKKPGELSIAISAGQMSHLASVALEQAADIDLMMIPYKGAGSSTVDLQSGRVQLSFGTAPTYLEQIRAGKVKALGIGGDTSLPLLPNVPLISKALPNVDANTWFGLFAPAKTPPEIIERLRKEVLAALQNPSMKERMNNDGFIPGQGITPDQFTSQIDTELGRWQNVIKKGKVSLE